MPKAVLKSHGRRGIATLEKHGVEHFRRLAALAVAKRQARPAATGLVNLDVGLRPDQRAFLDRVVAATGLSRAVIVREAIDHYWGTWEEAKETARKHRQLAPFSGAKGRPKEGESK